MCGGTSTARRAAFSASGLSPRVRGNPRPTSPRTARQGSIPACAGEPPKTPFACKRKGVYPRVCGGTRHRYHVRRLAFGEIGSIPACAGEPDADGGGGGGGLVYPRVCGGTEGGTSDGTTLWGLSPRVRGNHSQSADRPRRTGSIPACAGEPGQRTPVPPGQRVYPRVCGGTAPGDDVLPEVQGLSPRVRGNRQGRGPPRLAVGSIPACAGEPRLVGRHYVVDGVYPRVCGGTSSQAALVRATRGLSPRVRGNPLRIASRTRALGSIPACAGEPLTSRCTTPIHRVYPRVCGGTSTGSLTAIPSKGLSPRVRGNHAVDRGPDCDLGSIPACAGEPGLAVLRQAIPWVYPRVCGGTFGDKAGWQSVLGLSPRVRGNRGSLPACGTYRGSIPACAGEPSCLSLSMFLGWVYPRVCGGTQNLGNRIPVIPGLSPRVRGNPMAASQTA